DESGDLGRVAGMKRRAVATIVALADLAVVTRGLRERDGFGVVGRVERRKLQRDRKRTRRRAEERGVQVRIERRELLGGRLLGELGVRPEALERTRRGRLGDWRAGARSRIGWLRHCDQWRARPREARHAMVS